MIVFRGEGRSFNDVVPTIIVDSEFVGQLNIRKLRYTVFIVVVQLSSEEVQLVALRVREEAAPTLLAGLESRSPSRTPTRSERRAATHLGINARVFRRDAEEATATTSITL